MHERIFKMKNRLLQIKHGKLLKHIKVIVFINFAYKKICFSESCCMPPEGTTTGLNDKNPLPHFHEKSCGSLMHTNQTLASNQSENF